MKIKISKKRIRLIEFFFIGVLMGTFEDILAIFIATDAQITPQVILTAMLVAIPFAFITEYVVDHPNFWQIIFTINGNDKSEKNK